MCNLWLDDVGDLCAFPSPILALGRFVQIVALAR